VAWAAPLVGRSDDLIRLADVLAGRSAERTALIVGDAGIGKSRLLSEAAQHFASRGGTVLQGGCLPLTEALPLLPIVEALRSLTRDGTLLEEIFATQPAYVRQEIARLLPELGASSEDGELGPGEGWRRERLFTAVRVLLGAVADRDPVALLVEDLHWADRTTLDLLRFLIGSGVANTVPVAVSCRGDEAVPNPAAADWLAAVRSVPSVVEVTLGPLGPDESAEQVAALLGHQPTRAAVDALYRRTGGNPFFTEQLIAADSATTEKGRSGMAATMPPGLAALLTARVRRSSDAARQLLAVLAVAGRPVDEATMIAVSELGSEAVEDALIELIEARLVTCDEQGMLRPRHQLLAEAVNTDLLPSRRHGLHARFAATIGASAGPQVSAEVAAHWAAAGRVADELSWTATAAEAAEAMYAFEEAAQLWERVAQLWDLVDERPPGLRLPLVYAHAIDDRYSSGDSARAYVLTEEALTRVGDICDADELAVLLYRASISRKRDSLDAALRASEESVHLFAALPPSHERARALGRCGVLLDLAGRAAEATQVMSEGLAVAREYGSRSDEAAALIDLSRHELSVGDWERGIQLLEQASPLAGDSTDLEAVLWFCVHETDTQLRTGQLPQAVVAGERALLRARSLGGAAWAETAILASNVAEALLEMGQVRAAGQLLDPMAHGDPSRDTWAVHQVHARLDLVRGHVDDAWDRLAAVTAIIPGNLAQRLELDGDLVEVAVWRRRPEDAVTRVTQMLAEAADAPESRDAGPLLCASMRAYADLAEHARARHDDNAVRAFLDAGEQLVAQHRGLWRDPFADHPGVATAAAQYATWRAEHARLNDAEQADLWEAAANAWEALQRPHRNAYALFRHANALLAQRQTTAATAVLRRAATLAGEMVPLQGEITALARRARIDLAPAIPQPAPSADVPYSLTDRELDVLRLLARGRSNAQIGAALFMSPKTASVHVTHILRKLGVTGRVQAATLAERAGILDDVEDTSD
jgi:DNA-binding CsgD family transcriptional regulator